MLTGEGGSYSDSETFVTRSLISVVTSKPSQSAKWAPSGLGMQDVLSFSIVISSHMFLSILLSTTCQIVSSLTIP